MSIIREHNTNLDEYGELIQGHPGQYATEVVGGHIYTVCPIGVSLVAVPFVYLVDKVSGRVLHFNLQEHVKHTIPAGIEVFIASFIVALTAVFIYLISDLYFDKRRYSLLMVFIFAFCTSAWSTASRALWQHGPSMLMLSIALYLILKAKNKPRLIQFASLPLAFSYVVRPTNSISIVLLSVFVLARYRQQFLRYVLWSLPIAIPFFVYNLTVYHALLSRYYMPSSHIGANLHFWEGLAGNVISPGRGLFVFSPILAFSVYGVVTKVRNKQLEKLDYFLLGIIALHWIVVSCGQNWWAGHSFGPRFFADMIPYFVYFLIPAVSSISSLVKWRKHVVTSCFLVCVAFSFFVHYRGATTWDVFAWNGEPADVDFNTERLWDWSDPQFLRGLK